MSGMGYLELEGSGAVAASVASFSSSTRSGLTSGPAEEKEEHRPMVREACRWHRDGTGITARNAKLERGSWAPTSSAPPASP